MMLPFFVKVILWIAIGPLALLAFVLLWMMAIHIVKELRECKKSTGSFF